MFATPRPPRPAPGLPGIPEVLDAPASLRAPRRHYRLRLDWSRARPQAFWLLMLAVAALIIVDRVREPTFRDSCLRTVAAPAIVLARGQIGPQDFSRPLVALCLAVAKARTSGRPLSPIEATAEARLTTYISIIREREAEIGRLSAAASPSDRLRFLLAGYGPGKRPRDFSMTATSRFLIARELRLFDLVELLAEQHRHAEPERSSGRHGPVS